MKLLLDANLPPRLGPVLTRPASRRSTSPMLAGVTPTTRRSLTSRPPSSSSSLRLTPTSRCSWPRVARQHRRSCCCDTSPNCGRIHAALLVANLPSVLEERASRADSRPTPRNTTEAGKSGCCSAPKLNDPTVREGLHDSNRRSSRALLRMVCSLERQKDTADIYIQKHYDPRQAFLRVGWGKYRHTTLMRKL